MSIAREWANQTIAARLRTGPRDEASTTIKVCEEQAPRMGESSPGAALDAVLAQRDSLTRAAHPRRVRFLANLAWAAWHLDRKDAGRALRAEIRGLGVGDGADRAVIAGLENVMGK